MTTPKTPQAPQQVGDSNRRAPPWRDHARYAGVSDVDPEHARATFMTAVRRFRECHGLDALQKEQNGALHDSDLRDLRQPVIDRPLDLDDIDLPSRS